MADEDDKKSTDEYKYPEEYYSGDEYKPSDEEPGEPGVEEEPLEESPAQAQRRKRIFYALGVIGAIAVVYGILTFTTRKPTETVQVTPPITPPVQATVTPAVIPTPPTTPAVTTVSTDAERSMQEQLQSNQQAIASLQSQMQQLQADLAQLTENITAVTGQIQILANEIKALDLQRNIAESKKLLRFKMMQIYHLKALVPGRAWLQSLSGHVTTVTIGDRLPGYGIVQAIDTEQGTVTTSSGKLIQYGPKDS